MGLLGYSFPNAGGIRVVATQSMKKISPTPFALIKYLLSKCLFKTIPHKPLSLLDPTHPLRSLAL
jgi:hypothetical protein